VDSEGENTTRRRSLGPDREEFTEVVWCSWNLWWCIAWSWN